MHRRIALQTLGLVAAVLIGGALAWWYHVASIESLLDETAQSSLPAIATASDPHQLMALLSRPGIEVHLRVRHREMPPEGTMPPPEAQPPPGPMMMPPPSRSSWFARTIADLAHVRPRTVTVAGAHVILVPSAEALATWFSIDAAACALAIALIAIYAWRAYGIAARALERTLAEREAAVALFQRFLADAGHELRTPLTILSGYVDVLGGSPTGDERARVLRGMRVTADRMTALVEKMLLLSRLESPVAAPKVLAPARVAGEVVEAMRERYPSREIVVDADESARVRVDEDDLYEATRNLVENALRYAPESPVRVTASVDDGFVEIAVSDRGPGIAQDERERVFERFYRGRNADGNTGTGLGLAIVARVVERWTGTVVLECNGGTRVALRFPSAA